MTTRMTTYIPSKDFLQKYNSIANNHQSTEVWRQSSLLSFLKEKLPFDVPLLLTGFIHHVKICNRHLRGYNA